MASHEVKAAVALIALSASSGLAKASDLISVSGSVLVKGTEFIDGVDEGSFVLASSNPLVTDPSAPGPQQANPTGDYFQFGGYDFALDQPSAIMFETSLLDPNDTWKTIVANSVPGQPGTFPVAFDFLLPSPYTSTVSFDVANVTEVTNEPALYDWETNTPGDYIPNAPTTSVLGESVKLSRSDETIKYYANAVFQDPAMLGQVDDITFSGTVSLTKVLGGYFVSDSNSWQLRGLLPDATLLITGKSTESGLYSGPIPEPATYALMILGVGAVGAALRRRPRLRPA